MWKNGPEKNGPRDNTKKPEEISGFFAHFMGKIIVKRYKNEVKFMESLWKIQLIFPLKMRENPCFSLLSII